LAVLLGLSDELLTDLGEPNRSRTADGARSTTTAFPWALAAGALNERL
jgi:hydroxymethylglutaryl-CoA lyase